MERHPKMLKDPRYFCLGFLLWNQSDFVDGIFNIQSDVKPGDIHFNY